MSKTLEGMVTAMDAAKYPLPFYEGDGPEVDDFKAMRVALLWLADNVTDEMFDAFYAVERMVGTDVRPDWKKRFAAALRAAASGGE